MQSAVKQLIEKNGKQNANKIPKKDNKPGYDNNTSMNFPIDELMKTAEEIVDAYQLLNDKLIETSDVTSDMIDKYLRIINGVSDGTDKYATNMSYSTDAILSSADRLSAGFNNLDINMVSSFKDFEKIAHDFNTEILTEKIKTTNNNMKKETMDLGKDFEKTINKEMLAAPYVKNSTIIGRSVDSFFSKIQTGLQTPFKIAADIVNMPRRFASGVKDTIDSIKDNATGFKHAISGDFSDFLVSDKKKAEEKDAGIAKTPLNLQKVLRNSAVGISVAWLVAQLGIGGIGGEKESSSGGFGITDLIMGNTISKMLPMLMPKLLTFLSGAAFVAAIGYIIVEGFKTAEAFIKSINLTVEDSKDARTFGDIANREGNWFENKKAKYLQTAFGKVDIDSEGNVDPVKAQENAVRQKEKWSGFGRMAGYVAGGIGGFAGGAALAGGVGAGTAAGAGTMLAAGAGGAAALISAPVLAGVLGAAAGIYGLTKLGSYIGGKYGEKQGLKGGDGMVFDAEEKRKENLRIAKEELINPGNDRAWNESSNKITAASISIAQGMEYNGAISTNAIKKMDSSVDSITSAVDITKDQITIAGDALEDSTEQMAKQWSGFSNFIDLIKDKFGWLTGDVGGIGTTVFNAVSKGISFGGSGSGGAGSAVESLAQTAVGLSSAGGVTGTAAAKSSSEAAKLINNGKKADERQALTDEELELLGMSDIDKWLVSNKNMKDGGPSKDSIRRLDPNLLKNMYDAAQELGKPLLINSAHRSDAEQAILHKNNPNFAAPAGKSLHRTGLAVDIQAQGPEQAEMLKKFGLYRPYSRENWHWENAKGAAFRNNGANEIIAAHRAGQADAAKIAKQTPEAINLTEKDVKSKEAAAAASQQAVVKSNENVVASINAQTAAQTAVQDAASNTNVSTNIANNTQSAGGAGEIIPGYVMSYVFGLNAGGESLFGGRGGLA